MSLRPASPVVLVSGGTRGIGLGIVNYLLARDYRVVACGRGTTLPDDAKVVDRDPGRFHYQPCDLANREQISALVARTMEVFGRLDGLVNNAAVAYEGVLAIADETRLEQMLDVNLRGTILLTKECVRRMLVESRGSIVQISSIIAERGFSGLSVYAATKAGLLGFTRSLAREVGGRGIRVNAVAPGYVETEMSQALTDTQRGQIARRTPMGRLASVADIAPAVEFLLSPASGFITGQTLVVDGGASV